MGTINTLFHSGFIASCIAAGFLIYFIGSYTVLLASIFIGSFLNLLRVAMAHVDWKAFACVEFLIGFDFALSVPALFTWMAK